MALPPPAGPPSKKVAAAFAALAPEVIQKLRTPATESRFYDKSAPSTVERRQRVRSNFTMYCQIVHSITDESEMFRAETITDYTCRFIEGMAKVMVGRLGLKVKVGTLYQLKQSLQWWIQILIPTFSSIKDSFHHRVNHHIHMVAVDQALSADLRDKNNLGELELEMFFDQVMSGNKNLNNWKQQFAAWTIAFVTGARPGSYTVTKGYEKEAQVGGAVSASLPSRGETQTLRWSDIVFERMKGGIACTVSFRFNKGHQDPYKKIYIQGQRDFLFVPKKQSLFLDLSAILFALAVERGLFMETLDEILDGDNRYIKKNDSINKQAVFVAADLDGAVTPDKEMGYDALNRKLKEMCLLVGLPEYNNMYGFRRQAAQSTRHSHGVDAAQELLNHVPTNKAAFIHYDPKGFGRRDTTAFRLGGPELSSEDIVKHFAQSSLQWKPEEHTQESLLAELNARVKDRLVSDTEYEQLEMTLQEILSEAHTILQEIESIPEDKDYGYTRTNTKRYKTLMASHMDEPTVSAVHEKLNAHLAHRKTRRRDIPIAIRKEILKDIAAAVKEKATIVTSGEIEDVASANEHGDGIDEDDEDDEEVDEETIGATDTAPEAWTQIEEGQVVQIWDDEEPEEQTEDEGEAWKTFVKKWVQTEEIRVQSTDLECFLCRLDPTIPKETKAKLWNLSKLNTHMKGSTHDRKEQLRRAFNIDQAHNNGGKVACPSCDRLFSKATMFVGHVDDDHPELGWVEDE